MTNTRAHTKSPELADAPPMPRIVDVMQFRAKSPEQVLLFFTADQWKQAIKRVKKVEKLTGNRPHLQAVPMLGRPGGILVGQHGCPRGTSPAMLFNSARGSMPGPDDFDTIQPVCISDVPMDPPGPILPQPRVCQLVFRLPRPHQVGGISLACDNMSCTRRCVMEQTRQPNGVVVLDCGCRT